MIRFIHIRKWTFTALAGLFMVFAVLGAQIVRAESVSDRYPLLSGQFIQSARLFEAADDLILKTDTGIEITKPEMTGIIKKYDPGLKEELEKNLVFLLEQEILNRILEYEVNKSEISSKEKPVTQEQLSSYLSSMVPGREVSDEEIKAFYDNNKEMVGGIPFDQVEDSIREFLVEKTKQDGIKAHIEDLGNRHQIQINEKWMDIQYQLMTDNPVDRARASGKPTMIEFGATGCIPCDMMQPILDKLKKQFPDSLNVVFIHVHKHQVLASRFGIKSIPVQAFFDANGKEVFRHTGFFAEKDVMQQLEKMGVYK